MSARYLPNMLRKGTYPAQTGGHLRIEFASFSGSSSDLLLLVVLLFWLPHGLGFPMLLFQNVVDPPSGRGLRRRVVSLSFVGVAAAVLVVPLTF